MKFAILPVTFLLVFLLVPGGASAQMVQVRAYRQPVLDSLTRKPTGDTVDKTVYLYIYPNDTAWYEGDVAAGRKEGKGAIKYSNGNS